MENDYYDMTVEEINERYQNTNDIKSKITLHYELESQIGDLWRDEFISYKEKRLLNELNDNHLGLD